MRGARIRVCMQVLVPAHSTQALHQSNKADNKPPQGEWLPETASSPVWTADSCDRGRDGAAEQKRTITAIYTPIYQLIKQIQRLGVTGRQMNKGYAYTVKTNTLAIQKRLKIPCLEVNLTIKSPQQLF